MLTSRKQSVAPLSLTTMQPLGTLWVQGPQALHVVEHSSAGSLALVRTISAHGVQVAGRGELMQRQRQISRAMQPQPGAPSTAAVHKAGDIIAEVLYGPSDALCVIDDLLAHGALDEASARFITASAVVRPSHLLCIVVPEHA